MHHTHKCAFAHINCHTDEILILKKKHRESSLWVSFDKKAIPPQIASVLLLIPQVNG